MEIYFLIGIGFALYWRSRSIHFGYPIDAINYNKGNAMKTPTLFLSIIIWPIVIIVRLLSGKRI